MEFAERVQEVRREANLSTEELAARSGIAYNTLRRRLFGAPGRFTLDELSAIADAVTATAAQGDACFVYLLSGHREPAEAVSA